MAIPTSQVKLSNLQSEFGGSNPISLHEYFAGAGLVTNPAPTSGNQSAIIPTGGVIRLSNFRGVAKITNGPGSGQWAGGSIVASTTVTTTTSIASAVRFTNAGQVIATGGPSPYTLQSTTFGTFNSNPSATLWYTPLDSSGSLGNLYWIRITTVSGPALNYFFPSGSLGTWMQLGTYKEFGFKITGGSPSYNGTFLVQISSTASGSNIVASGNITINFSHV